MKLKQKPEDFRVREESRISYSDDGDFAIYLLRKRRRNTIEAIRQLARALEVPEARIGYSGLKDKHAETEQHLSVPHGPRSDLQQEQLELKYLGQASHPVRHRTLWRNVFELVARDLTEEEVDRIRTRSPVVQAIGLPNYFDDQRFGSIVDPRTFPARWMLEGELREAARQFLTLDSPVDRARLRWIRRTVRRNWGDWEKCCALLPPCLERELTDYLRRHPEDFRGALNCIDPAQLRLAIQAFQSYLWNESLRRYLQRTAGIEEGYTIRHQPGELFFYGRIQESVLARLSDGRFPLLSHDTSFADEKQKAPIEEVLSREGLRLEQFKMKAFPEASFKSGLRRALLFPENIRLSEPFEDEVNPGSKALRLQFKLRRGSYATLVMKRLAR